MRMDEFWRSQRCRLVALTVGFLYLLNLSYCRSINDEGLALLRIKEKVVSDPYGALTNWKDEVGVGSPCSWVGVGCSDGYVVALNLQDLCLSGTLAREIGNMVHVKSIILRNNSFSGVIPDEIFTLEKLEVLDLGFNNFSGPQPYLLESDNDAMGIILLDNNELLHPTRSKIFNDQKRSEIQTADNKIFTAAGTLGRNGQFISWNFREMKEVPRRKLLQFPGRTPAMTYNFPRPLSRAPPPPDSLLQPDPVLNPPSSLDPEPDPVSIVPPRPDLSPSPELVTPPLPTPETRVPPPSLSTPTERTNASRNNGMRNLIKIIFAVTGGFLLLLLIGGIFLFYRCNVATVNPWVTGLSGQLQRAFVNGIPKLKRTELVAACEDFSNVIGSSSVFTLYKGTLSSGIEIAVASIGVTSAKEWPDSLESQFRKKIDTLSRVNHRNFVCLLGYCMEKEPFTRMMVFEYAPNGTLFEHLHIREAEHLDWAMRLRIAMGVSYALEYMHQLTPAVAHTNLTSSSIYLTEDYAGKVSDFIYDNEGTAADAEPNIKSNVYSFGVILFEMLTGRLPYSVGGESPENWASDYLTSQPLREIVDPTLRSYRADQLQLIGNVIQLCTHPDPGLRPSIKEVCEKLREITRISLDGAVPKLSSLWWAELEILSTEAN